MATSSKKFSVFIWTEFRTEIWTRVKVWNETVRTAISEIRFNPNVIDSKRR